MSRLQYKLHDEWILTNLFFQGWLDETLLQYSLIKMGVCVCVCWNLLWLQTPLMQLTVAVITVVTPCLLTTGGQRSGAKVALMIKLYKSSLHLVFFFREAALLSARLSHTIFSVSCVIYALLGCVRGVQLFLNVPCIIHGVGGFFFCGLQASWYTHYSFICSWFISSRNVSITLLKLFFPIIRYYSHRRHNPLLLDSVCSLFWVVIK